MSAGGLLFSMRKESIVTGEYYHVYSRGVDRRRVYEDDSDYERFVRGMIVFNDSTRACSELRNLRSRPSRSKYPLVKIISYTLMPNHHHFLLQQIVDGGIAHFMQRLGAGYACYFNRRYARTGRLWESEYKAVHIETDAQLVHVSRYIHFNPLKLYFPKWKICGVPSWGAAQNALVSYAWSSYRHFLGVEQNKAVDADVLTKMFNDSGDYKNFMLEWVIHNTAPEAP